MRIRDSNHATGDFSRYRAQLSADTLGITFRACLRHAQLRAVDAHAVDRFPERIIAGLYEYRRGYPHFPSLTRHGDLVACACPQMPPKGKKRERTTPR